MTGKTAKYDARKLLRQFDKYYTRVTVRLEQRYGREEAHEITARAREEFRELIPRIPYIGGNDNVFTPVMIINGWIVATHRVMARRGYAAEDVVRIAYEASDDYFRAFPPIVDKAIKVLATTRPVLGHLRKQAARSQERRYPEDFVYTCSVHKRKGEVELQLEFVECAVQKYYDAEGVPELKPFCNFFDPIYSRYFGLGVAAEHTIGLGCDTCKLNYNNRRQTILPSNIQAIVKH